MSNQKEVGQTIRKRAKNFTAEEEVLLVDLVESRKHVIANKKSDAVTWKEKEDAWRAIEEDFAASTGTHRHWKALRDKLDMLKRKSRSEMAEKKSETYRKGGGVSTASISHISTKVASMLGDSATGLQNFFDSDSSVIEVIDGIEENCVNCIIENVEEDQVNNEENTKQKVDWSNWKPVTLEQPKSKELVLGAKRKKKYGRRKN